MNSLPFPLQKNLIIFASDKEGEGTKGGNRKNRMENEERGERQKMERGGNTKREREREREREGEREGDKERYRDRKREKEKKKTEKESGEKILSLLYINMPEYKKKKSKWNIKIKINYRSNKTR